MFTASCEIIYLATKVVLTTKQSQIKKDNFPILKPNSYLFLCRIPLVKNISISNLYLQEQFAKSAPSE